MINKPTTPISPNYQWCANCAYWTGDRKINGFFGRAEIEDMCQKGQCVNKDSFFNCWLPCNATCSKFKKHPALKN